MKTAVVFYSLDGNCALVAEEIKAKLNADLIRLYTKDEKKRSKIGNLFWGGAMVLFRKKPPLIPYTFDPSVYDLIILGAPVWAASPAPPIQTFIHEAGITGRKIAIFACHGGGKENSLGKLRTLLAGNNVVAETDFFNPCKSGIEEVRQKISDWIKSF